MMDRIHLITIDDAAHKCGIKPNQLRDRLSLPVGHSRRPKTLTVYDEDYLRIEDVESFIKRSRERQGQSEIVKDDVFKEKLTLLDGLHDSLIKKAVLCLSWFGGLRVSEISQLTIDSVYSDGEIRQTAVLYRDMTKTKTFRKVFLNHPFIQEHLLNHIKRRVEDGAKPQDVVFISPRKQQQFTAVNMAVYMKRIYKALDSGECSSHSGRAATVKRHLSRGKTLKFAGKIVGHKSTSTTAIYDRVDDDEILEAMAEE